MSIHYFVSLFVGGIMVYYTFAQVYVCYYIGFSQCSSIFLNVAKIELHDFFKILFAFSFLVIIWSWINVYNFWDMKIILEKNFNTFLFIHLLCNLILTILQYYWGFLIMQTIIKNI